MITLRGGARRHDFVTDCGHRYDGQDRKGFVSFLPAGCERRLRLKDVAWEWASIALSPAAAPSLDKSASLRAFSNGYDPFLFGLMDEFRRLLKADGSLDATYCDTMTLAVIGYIERRYLHARDSERVVLGGLPARQVRRIADYVEAHLGESIRISALASLLGLSEGHFHRAFRDTTGQTPLQYVNQRRIQRAMELLSGDAAILEVALEVGFVSASHFARVFRGITGTSPAQYRRER